MKQIGIVTYHRAHNFGALLQAYGLKSYLESMGYKVDIVDYFPRYHSQMYALWPFEYFKKWKISQKAKFIIDFPFIVRKKHMRRRIFEDFINSYIKPAPIGAVSRYDVLVYGSDQIWRYQDNPLFKGYNEVYFGKGEIAAQRRITYSASMGKMDQFDDHVDFFRESLKNFDSIAVREDDLLEKIQPLATQKVALTIDPIFLIPIDSWKKLISDRKRNGPYILLYNLLSDDKLKRTAEEISRLTGFPIVELAGKIKRGNQGEAVEEFVGPKEFLTWLFYADFVVTSSFHGVAFSILFQKQFLTFLPRNSGRVISLLNRLGIGDRFISVDNFKSNEIRTIDYGKVSQPLKEMVDSSKQYLDTSINFSEN